MNKDFECDSGKKMHLKQCFEVVKKRIWIIAVVTAVLVIVTAVVNFFVLKPVYQADTSLYVGKQVTEVQTVLAYNDIMLNTQLVKDYREFARSRLVTGTVIKELKLKGITLKAMANKIGVSLKNDTRLIQITAKDGNPKIARDIANKTADVFKEKVVELMDVENVQVIDRALYSGTPVKPDKARNIGIAFFLGISMSAGLILLIEYLDTTVKTPEDIKRYVSRPVIGNIPLFQDCNIKL